MERTFSITVSENVFQKIYTVAATTKSTVDDVISNSVNVTYAAPSDIPTSIANELASMQQMKDQSLWDAIEPSVSPEQQERLTILNALCNDRELQPSELNEKEELLMEHHHSVLRRAQAIAILTLRGYTISDELLLNSVV